MNLAIDTDTDTRAIPKVPILILVLMGHPVVCMTDAESAKP